MAVELLKVPQPGEHAEPPEVNVQLTPVLELLATVAVNCCVEPA